jgi:hypothetical protein
MTIYDPSAPLVSLHIPKAGGTSLRDALQIWFGSRLHLHYRGNNAEPPTRVALRPGLCIHGHFNRCRGIGALSYYPGSSQYIVFLRNPFDRFVSQWRYLHFQQRAGIRIPELENHPNFDAWFESRRRAAAEGDDPFSFLAQLPRRIEPWEASRAFGRDFLFVGITERFSESLDLLAAVLRKPRVIARRLNSATENFRAGDRFENVSAYRAEHERAFPLEYAVYDSAHRWLDAALARPADMRALMGPV